MNNLHLKSFLPGFLKKNSRTICKQMMYNYYIPCNKLQLAHEANKSKVLQKSRQSVLQFFKKTWSTNSTQCNNKHTGQKVLNFPGQNNS